MTAEPYSGTDCLAVMAEARNYNAWLVAEVLRHAGGAKTAVDFGAGRGTFARALRDRGLDATCIEPDAQLAQTLRGLGFVCHATIDELAAESAEYVFSLNVLEHIADDEAALKAIHRCLRPGGTLYLYVPAFAVLFSSMDRKVGHFRRYRIGDLRAKLQRAGFEVRHARYADSLGFFVTLLYRLVGDRGGRINPGVLRFYDRFLFPLSRLLDWPLGPVLGKNVAVVASRRA